MDIIGISTLVVSSLLGIEKIIKYMRSGRKRSKFRSECCGATIERESSENNLSK